ncbi:hypothetical protein FHS35_002006 [Streptomyces umbrinus]|uniref:hypothetical protein n=1 Tax=Streptomyces umbrinus TaxID=67370 RepID=UPI00167D2E04|nr:hypothetical protein [Streptomyces umbrinus]MCR3725158.1 hypothetical protein [Streptomyces umbrinus]GHH63068.1 hypothetical protein GCM10018775_80230 [Streptomyces umbrinus]
MIALCTQSGNDLHAPANGGLSSVKAPAQPTRERPTPLYWVIGEASLPDADSECFIHSPATATEHFREYGPAPIAGEPIAPVLASDGGGHLFTIGASEQVGLFCTPS